MGDLDAPGAILLIHDGELADVRQLLDELGLGFVESSPKTAGLQDDLAASVVLASPQYLANRLEADEGGGAIRIAVGGKPARTLRAMLARGGVKWQACKLRRAIEPLALEYRYQHGWRLHI